MNIYIILDEYGNIEIHLYITELLDIDINIYNTIIEKEINKFLSELKNNINLSINTINEYNLIIDKIDINILYNNIFNNEDFQELINKFNNNSLSNLYKIRNIDNTLEHKQALTLLIIIFNLFKMEQLQFLQI